MAYLKETITAIDNAFDAAFNDQRFVKRFFGLCKLVPRNSEEPLLTPAVIASTGMTDAIIDDNYTFITYHRTISNSITQDTDGFGDDNNDLIESSKMLMVIYADSARLSMDEHKLTSLVLSRLINQVNFNKRGFDAQFIEPNSIIKNSVQLFSQEFSGVAFNLHPDSILIGLEYTVNSHYQASCLDICEPC